jgi:hypothetical protein
MIIGLGLRKRKAATKRPYRESRIQGLPILSTASDIRYTAISDKLWLRIAFLTIRDFHKHLLSL